MLGGKKNAMRLWGLFIADVLSPGDGYDIAAPPEFSMRPVAPDTPVPSILMVIPAFPAPPVFRPILQ